MGRKSTKNVWFGRNWMTFSLCVQFLADRSQCHDQLLSNEHPGKPTSDQLLQPMASSADQCVLAGEQSPYQNTIAQRADRHTNIERAITTICTFLFFFSFSPLAVGSQVESLQWLIFPPSSVHTTNVYIYYYKKWSPFLNIWHSQQAFCSFFLPRPTLSSIAQCCMASRHPP